MARFFNTLIVLFLIAISAGLVFTSIYPIQNIEINKVTSSEGKRSSKANTLNKPVVVPAKNPVVTKTPVRETPVTKKVETIRKPTIIRINDNCQLTNFKLNRDCYGSIDLVGQ